MAHRSDHTAGHTPRPSAARTRRSGLAALVGLALVAAACGGNSPSSSSAVTPDATSPASSPATDGDTASTDAPAETVPATDAPLLTNAPTTTEADVVATPGGTLRVAIEADATGYNPTVDAWARGGNQVARAIFDPLATYDADGKVVPYLAESIVGSADATEWTITLRPGITFHDGTPLNAEAVQANFAAVLASPQYKDQLALVAGMTVVDDLTLSVQMSAPWGAFPQALTGEVGSQVGYIAAPSMLADPDGGRNPIGTGPFRFVEWVPDDHLTVERNDDYWQTPAYLDQVTFLPIPDTTSRKAAFDAGDVDVYLTGSSKEIIDYQSAGDVNVVIGSPTDPDVIMFNTSVAPLDDVRVRRALVMAIDIPRVFDFLDATGVKQPMDSPYPNSSFWHVDSDYPTYDPEGAKQLIDEYTAEKGPVSFEFAGQQDPFLVSYQELFQSMWSEIGVDAQIVSRAQSENIDAVVGGTFQAIVWGGQGGGDPDRDYSYFHSGGLNFTRYNSPEIDAAMDAGRALADPEARKEQYAIVQEAFGRDVPYAWIGSNQMAVVTGSNVNDMGVLTLPDGTPGTPVAGGLFFLDGLWLQQ